MKVAYPLIFALLATPLIAQEQLRVFIDPQDNFAPYMAAALQKKGVPVTVTTDVQQADYTLAFHTNNSNGSVVQGVLTGLSGNYNSGAFNEVTLTVINDKTKNVTFSYTCKKYDKYSGASDRNATSVAECLAKHWKSKLK